MAKQQTLRLGRRAPGAGDHPPDGRWPAKKAWIVIELADSTGQPRAGEAFSLTPPGGDPVDGTLDAAGKVRIEGLDPGTCRIAFPDLGYEGENTTTTSPPGTDP